MDHNGHAGWQVGGFRLAGDDTDRLNNHHA